MNLGHAIQVVDQNDPVPARILPLAQPTSTPRQPETMTDELTLQPQTQIMTDEATPLRVSGVATWISLLVLCLFAAVN